MKKILSIIVLIILSTSARSQEWQDIENIIISLKNGEPVKLDPIVYDFTGYRDIEVNGLLDMNGATIICNQMLQDYFNDNHYLFLLNDTIKNGFIIGPSGRNYSNLEGWFNGIQVMKKGVIENMNFKNCDKMAIRVLGDRWSNTDTTMIINCTFDSIPRDGAGYGIWNHGGVVYIINCKFNYLRHAFDAGSEANKTTILNSEFRNCFYIPIHQHRYIGDSVGIGLTVKGCKFYDTYLPIDIGVPFSGQNLIDSNFFAGNIIGKTGTETIPIGNNFMNGIGMIPAPNIQGRKSYQVGEKTSLGIGSVGYWNNGIMAKEWVTSSTIPSVKVVSVHVGGLSDTMTVTFAGSGSYTTFKLMSTAPVEIWSATGMIMVLDPLKTIDFSEYYFKEAVKIRIMGSSIGADRTTFNVADGFRSLRIRTSQGTAHIDNFAATGGFYDTFEKNIRIKIRNYPGYVELSK